VAFGSVRASSALLGSLIGTSSASQTTIVRVAVSCTRVKQGDRRAGALPAITDERRARDAICTVSYVIPAAYFRSRTLLC
jgi:hypothetical protein